MIIRELRNNISNSLCVIYDKNEAINISEWLIMEVLGVKEKIFFIDMLDEEIDKNSLKYKVILQKFKRLLRNEPIQYVLHKAWFYGFEFYVNRYTLIPRPETEEMCLKIIQTFIEQKNMSVLDIGTGSGCISIILKKYFPSWSVVATDVSINALKIAQCNAIKHNTKIKFLNDDIFRTELTKSDLKFDIIVSNPPYVPLSEKEKIKPNVKNYEPAIALFVPDENPLIFYEAICNVANYILKNDGYIFLEVHENYATKVEKLLTRNSYDVILFYDMQNKQRFLMAKRI